MQTCRKCGQTGQLQVRWHPEDVRCSLDWREHLHAYCDCSYSWTERLPMKEKENVSA
jgi:hypothetical protein